MMMLEPTQAELEQEARAREDNPLAPFIGLFNGIWMGALLWYLIWLGWRWLT